MFAWGVIGIPRLACLQRTFTSLAPGHLLVVFRFTGLRSVCKCLGYEEPRQGRKSGASHPTQARQFLTAAEVHSRRAAGIGGARHAFTHVADTSGVHSPRSPGDGMRWYLEPTAGARRARKTPSRRGHTNHTRRSCDCEGEQPACDLLPKPCQGSGSLPSALLS